MLGKGRLTGRSVKKTYCPGDMAHHDGPLGRLRLPDKSGGDRVFILG